MIVVYGGSLDRFIGFKILSDLDSSNYYIIYEALTKFWIIPYLLSPIVFAKYIDNIDLLYLKLSIKIIIFFGCIYIALVIFFLLTFENFLNFKFGSSEDKFFIIVFSFSLVICSLTMILMSYIQAIGKVRESFIIGMVTMVISGFVYYLFALHLKTNGLFLGWLVKSLIEFSLALCFIRMSKYEVYKKLLQLW
jgi:Na+-driven multidrug efflux pump